MKLATLPTKLVLLFSILSSIAFLGDDDTFSFDISTSRIYAPGDPETALEFSGNGLADNQLIKFRAFRVNDPVAFFLAQTDPHSPTLLATIPPNTFDMLNVGLEKIRRDARYSARDVMPEQARRAIRDVADVNGVKADQRDKQKNPPKQTVGTSTDNVPKGAEGYQIAGEWEHRLGVKADDAERNWRYESIPVPIRDKGVYLIEARVRGKRAISALIVSEYGMIIKQVDDDALAFVTNRKTGQKVSDVPLHFARGNKELKAEETGRDGLARVTLPPRPERVTSDEDWEAMWYSRDNQVLVVGEKDGNVVISDPYYYNDFGSGKFQVYLHTDRPVYRPAQEVYYRGIIRKINDDGTYAQAAGQKVYLEITDSHDGAVKKDSLTLDAMGTFNGMITLAEEPPLGNYSIKVTVAGEEHWFNFSVEEYKKPEYKVVVTTDKAQYTRGDEIHAKVEADYFFGSPVANAQVEYFVYRAQYWRPWWRGSDWEFLYEEGDDFYTYRMEMVHSEEATLGPDGKLDITYQTDATAGEDYVYRIQANVVDNSRRSIAGARSVEVTRGEFYISARTDKYVYRPREKAKIFVEMATFDGDAPVAAPFTASIVRTWWEQTKRRDTSAHGPGSDTVMVTEYTKKTEKIWNGSGSTNSDGKGEIVYSPERAGYFEVEIEATDRRGTKVTESSYMYVSDDSYADWYREGSGDVQIIPDKTSYKPGETMSALVIMPAAGIDALVTMEGATIYSSQVERLTSTSAVVHVPIEERHAPVVYLNASAMVNDELYTESKRITVVPEGKLIKLEVTTDKDIYRPGAAGTVMIRAVDERGAPVRDADVAVAMVDEAIYSIQPDATPDIQRSFYGNRWNDVITTSSLNFSFYGNSRKITEGDDLYSEVDGRRGNVRFASTGARDRRNLAYGDVKGEMFVQPAMRKNFKDMMSWSPSVRTDGEGRARINVTFPDNLTTWRITARGITANSAVGQSITRVIARKDLMVRMEMPRFLVQGDELLVATTVHNYLKSGKQTQVEVTGTNATIAESRKSVEIGAGAEERIDWKVTAPTVGNITLQVKALTNEESDAMELTIPVLPRGLKMATAQSATIMDQRGSKSLTYTVPENSDATTRNLKLALSPSAAGSTLGALDQLIGYPYGCVEQTMSRFLPTVVVAQMLKELNIPFNEARRAEIPKMVARGFSKLYGMQHNDGGWGWWENDATDPYMTAYVIYGMTIARRADYELDEDRYNSGVARLRAYIEGTGDSVLDDASKAYVLYVGSIVNAGKNDPVLAAKTATLARKDTILNYTRALLALASMEQGNRALATQLVSKLESNATMKETGASWKGSGHYLWHWYDDDVETSAFALRAIFRLRGETELVTKGVQWLLSRKEGDAWHNTRQTANVIYSLTDYLKKTRELEPDYTVTVKVNGAEAWSGRMTRADIFAPEKEVTIDAAKLKPGANNVTIEKSGNGRLYTSGLLTYFATGSAVQPASAGMKVTREYYLLKKERDGDVYVYQKKPFTGTVRTGDEIFVKVKIMPDNPYEYVMLEDPLPAGCEVVESTEGYTIPGEADYDYKTREREGYSWYWWYASREVRDEKVAFFADWLPEKERTFSYIVRAQIPGNYGVMPAVGSLMYYPEVRGNSSQISMRITP
jgi:uncharacterized protein YfaS (alpha-2-macroglobulin family)